jgi:hypothetical protein
MFSPFYLFLPLIYLAFHTFDYARTWVFQTRIVRTKFDIYDIIFKLISFLCNQAYNMINNLMYLTCWEKTVFR